MQVLDLRHENLQREEYICKVEENRIQAISA